jgi:glycosyltransferase involved in cell wall biosynthesis
MMAYLACGLAERRMASTLVLSTSHDIMAGICFPRDCQVHRISQAIPCYLGKSAATASTDVYLREILPAAYRIADVLRSEGADLLLINTLTDAAGLLAASIVNLPVVTWVHGIVDNHVMGGREASIRPLFDELLLRSSVSIVSPTERISNHYRKEFGLEVTTIPNGCLVRDSVCLGLKGGVIFACLDSFESLRNHETLLKSAYILRLCGYDFTLDLYGEGPVKEGIRQSIERLGLDSNVVLNGRAMDTGPVYRNATALVTASRIEGVGVDIMEAMAWGRPVVVSELPGHRELVPREAGFLCAVNEPTAFAERMAWISENPQQVREMGYAARKIAAEKHSMDRLCQDFYGLFGRVLSRERSSQSFALRDRYRLVRSHLQCVA